MNKEVFVNGSDVHVQTFHMFCNKYLIYKIVSVLLSLKKGNGPCPTFSRTEVSVVKNADRGLCPRIER